MEFHANDSSLHQIYAFSSKDVGEGSFLAKAIASQQMLDPTTITFYM